MGGGHGSQHSNAVIQAEAFGFLVLLALGCALTQNCATVASLWRAHVHRFHASQYIK